MKVEVKLQDTPSFTFAGRAIFMETDNTTGLCEIVVDTEVVLTFNKSLLMYIDWNKP